MRAPSSKPAAKTRVVVADDHPFLRAGLATMINAQPDFACVGEADTVANTQKKIAEQKPDMAVVDLFMGDGDGLELIKTLRAQHEGLRILVLSQHEESLYAERALRAGAQGYIMKQREPAEVLAALRAILTGELYVSPRIAAMLLRRTLQGRPAAPGSGVDSLTDRELQVFRLLGTGLSTRRIAEELNLSFKTIETYRENIKHKLGLADASALLHQANDWVQKNTPMPKPEDLAAAGRRATG